MSSPISHGSRTPAGSQATGGTEYSPENLRYDSVSESSGKASPPESTNINPWGSFDATQFAIAGALAAVTRDDVQKSHRGEISISQASMVTDPFSGTTKKEELSNCFVYIAGNQEIFDYHNGGRFSSVREFESFDSIHTRSKGREVFLYFKDRRDAHSALQFFRRLNWGNLTHPACDIKAVSITAAEFCFSTRDMHKPKQLADLGRTFETGYDGQIIFNMLPPMGLPADERVQAYAKDKVTNLVQKIADVYRSFVISVDMADNKINVLVELFEPNQAEHVVNFFRTLHDTDYIEDMRVRCSLRGEAAFGSAPRPSRLRAGSFDAKAIDDEEKTPTAAPPVFGVIGDKRSAPLTTVKTTFDFEEHTEELRFNPTGNLNSALGLPLRPGLGHRRDTKNFIDLSRVKHGLDVRTTVMLRNIPNRLTHKMVKEIIDEYVWGCYDFMYLRIDFTNGCNVGYAFINFAHPKDVATFVQCVAGKKWEYSDKVAEVSYATMQGRETLVQKFRNSSVMNEVAESRPKLYKTHPDAKAGHEEPFPGPDNLFKLARSNQNAAHIGLFSPNRGAPAHLGDRHRHGRFDRGTSFAMLERMVAENAMLRNMRGLPPRPNLSYY